MIELLTLGTGEIRTSKGTLTPSQRVVFAAALYVIVERGAPVSRAKLASLLWPDIPFEAQSHRLRQTLYQLKTLGIPIPADRNSLRLPRDAASTDFDRIAIGGFELPPECDSLAVLPGYAAHLSEQFETWLEALRERVHANLTRILVAKLRKARTAGDWQAVERVSKMCLALDQYNEAGILARAEAFAMRGQKAAAVSILDSYLSEMGPDSQGLVLPVSILRRRVLQNDERAPNAQAGSGEPEFVGRGSEMAALTGMMEKARKGGGGGCLIAGEPGIGKSRLSAELAKFAELQGVRVERVSCKRPDMDQPLSAFVSLIPRLRDLPGALGCSYSTLVWLKRLTEVDSSSQEAETPGEDSATLYTHLRSAVFDLLDAISEENCTLVIVEDVQWLDRASAKLFAAILESASSKRILFLFNSREIRNPLTSCVSTQSIAVLHLTPLRSSDALALIRMMLIGESGDREELDLNWLIKTGDGNPYFLQELTKYWLETGLQRDVPPSIATILDERLSRLTPVAHQLLQACAVLGENCNLERVEQIFDYAPQNLLTAVQELSSTGMVRSNPGGQDVSQDLVIRHDLLSIEVLKTLAPASLAFIHRRCGAVLEREVLGPSKSISLIRACAFHWYQAGDAERAYGLAIRCADHLLEIGLAMDAAKAFEGALGFASTSDRHLEVFRRIIEAYRMAADRPALVEAIRRFRSFEDSIAPHSHHDDIEVLELEALKTTEVDLDPVLARAVGCVQDHSLPAAHRVKMAVVAIKVATSVAGLETMEMVYREVEPLFPEPTVDVRSRLQIQVIYHTMCGDLRRGLDFARKRLAFERVQGLTIPLLNAMSDLAFVLRRTGPVDEMLAVCREAYATAIEHKDYAMARDCAEKLGSVLEDEDLPGAKEWMDRSLENGKFSEEIHASFSFNADSARIALRENRLDDARWILDNGFDWTWLISRQMWLAVANGLRIRLLIAEQADVTDLLPHVDELRRQYSVWAGLGRQDYELAGLVRGLIYTGHDAEARTYLEDFVLKTRRDLTPPSAELESLIDQLAIGPRWSLARVLAGNGRKLRILQD